jgi:arginyl-tRNA synthetase
LAQNADMTGARLFMARNIGQVLRNGLRLMGVEAAYNM